MEFQFSENNLAKLNEHISHYPHKKAAVMGALWLAQEQNGWISGEVMREVARILDITLEDVLGVVTFYTMYFQKPMGKFHLQVCTNVSCMLRGGYKIYDHIREKYKLEHNGVTEDGMFSLEEVECMGSCGTAPMIAVNEDFYENINIEEVDKILESLKNKN